MIFIKWFLLLIVNLLTNLVNYPLAPIVVLFANKDGWLPKWLWWFQMNDNSLDGDSGWRIENMPYRPENNHYQRWINRFHWLWRNKLYGFSRSCLSITYNPTTDIIIIYGDNRVGNGPEGKSGWCYKKLIRGKNIIGFKFYYIRQYKNWPNKCIRILIGWKLPNIGETDNAATFGFSPSPWMHFIK